MILNPVDETLLKCFTDRMNYTFITDRKKRTPLIIQTNSQTDALFILYKHGAISSTILITKLFLYKFSNIGHSLFNGLFVCR